MSYPVGWVVIAENGVVTNFSGGTKRPNSDSLPCDYANMSWQPLYAEPPAPSGRIIGYKAVDENGNYRLMMPSEYTEYQYSGKAILEFTAIYDR